VDIIDAMFLAQYIVGLRNLGDSDFNIVNGASVNQDGAESDKIDIIDAMYIAQYEVGIRDEYFELVP